MIHDQEFPNFISIHQIIMKLNFRPTDFFTWMIQNFEPFFKGKLYIHYLSAEHHPNFKNYPKPPTKINSNIDSTEREKLNQLRFLVPIDDEYFWEATKNSELRLFLKEAELKENKKDKSAINDILFGDESSPLHPLTISSLRVDVDTARAIIAELRVHLNVVAQTLTISGEEKSLTPTQTIYLWALYELGEEARSFIRTAVMYSKCGELQDMYNLDLVNPVLFKAKTREKGEVKKSPEHPSRIFKDNTSQEKRKNNWIEIVDDEKSNSKLLKLVLHITNITRPPTPKNENNFRPD